MELKQARERQAIENFLSEYNRIYDAEISITKQPDPPEPDIICENKNNELIGLEVVTIYENQQEAKFTWDNARGKTQEQIYVGSLNKEPDRQYCEKIAGEINKKIKKKYDHNGKLWLIVDWNYPLSDGPAMDAAEGYFSGRDFSDGPFSEIWLVDRRPYREIEGSRICHIRLLWPNI